MEYTVERIEELARCARISLDEERARRLHALLLDMKETASVLKDGKHLPDPFLGAVSLDGLREDAVEDSMERDEVLSLSSSSVDGCVSVPRAVEG